MQPNGNPPVDLDGFRSAMRDVGADEIVEPILAVYMEEAKSLFSSLSAAVSCGDVETICATAHTLKSWFVSYTRQRMNGPSLPLAWDFEMLTG